MAPSSMYHLLYEGPSRSISSTGKTKIEVPGGPLLNPGGGDNVDGVVVNKGGGGPVAPRRPGGEAGEMVKNLGHKNVSTDDVESVPEIDLKEGLTRTP